MPVPGPFRPHVVRSDRRAGGDVAQRDDAVQRHVAHVLLAGLNRLGRPARPLDGAEALHDLGQLDRLDRALLIGSGQRSRGREVLLEEVRAEPRPRRARQNRRRCDRRSRPGRRISAAAPARSRSARARTASDKSTCSASARTACLTARTAWTVRSISSGVDMPVETIIGLPLRATCCCSGRLVSSPEPVLYAGTPTVSRKSAASRENGVDRNTMPRFAAQVAQREVVVARQRGPRQEIEQRLADVGSRRAAAQHLVLGEMRLELDRVGAGFRRRARAPTPATRRRCG
mgnify:CR=1 FL=1